MTDTATPSMLFVNDCPSFPGETGEDDLYWEDPVEPSGGTDVEDGQAKRGSRRCHATFEVGLYVSFSS